MIRNALRAATLLVLLWASAVVAQGAVSWRVPAGCPDAAQAAAENVQLAQHGSRPRSASAARV
ncbi:MAG TPA: hypothetical protein VMF89_22640, partial [Polyangiales bacterium]|nr:hypothetical protein [Polyangiales bacterium]